MAKALAMAKTALKMDSEAHKLAAAKHDTNAEHFLECASAETVWAHQPAMLQSIEDISLIANSCAIRRAMMSPTEFRALQRQLQHLNPSQICSRAVNT